MTAQDAKLTHRPHGYVSYHGRNQGLAKLIEALRKLPNGTRPWARTQPC